MISNFTFLQRLGEETEKGYEVWKEMIMADKMPHSEVIEFLKNNPEFASWYLKDVADAVTNGDK
jgi:hypothetical protein